MAENLLKIVPAGSTSLEPLHRLIEQKNTFEVYYPLREDGYADYSAKVEWHDGMYHYAWGGHGIGSSKSLIKNSEDLIDRILSDNDQFNSGNTFHLKLSE